MMTPQPGSWRWDSWDGSESAALLSVTNEAGKWVRTTGWGGCTTGPRHTAAWAGGRGEGREPKEGVHGWECGGTPPVVPGSLRYTNKALMH